MGITECQELVPQPCTHIQAENVGKQGNDPLKQKHTALYLQVCHHLGQSWHSLFQHAHVAVEKDVDLTHIERVKVEHDVLVHHICEEFEAHVFISSMHK